MKTGFCRRTGAISVLLALPGWFGAPLLLSADILGQATTPNGSAFVETCAGVGTSNGLTPFEAFGGGPGSVCNYAIGASVTTSSFSGPPGPGVNPSVDSSAGSAQKGQIYLSENHSGDANAFYTLAYAYGGWNDTYTATVPGLGNGAVGTWVVPITVLGTLTSFGPSGGSEANVEIFVNGSQVGAGGPAPDGQSAINAWNQFVSLNSPVDPCRVVSGVEMSILDANSGNNNQVCPTVNISKTIYFAIAATVGTPYQLGIFANVFSQQTPSGGLPNLQASGGTADLAHSILWGGPGYFIDSNGQVHTDISIASGSGYDYNVAAVDTAATPEPSSFGMLLVGCALLGLVIRHRNTSTCL